jgi:hypothetical protein
MMLSSFPTCASSFRVDTCERLDTWTVSSGNMTGEMIQQYIKEREGELPFDDSQFQIDPSWTLQSNPVLSQALFDGRQ